MKAKTFVGIIAVGTLLYVGYKAFAGNRLIGSFNSGQSGTSKLKTTVPASEVERIKLYGQLSNLEAKMYGMIDTDETKDQIQKEIDGVVQKLTTT